MDRIKERDFEKKHKSWIYVNTLDKKSRKIMLFF